MEQHSDKARYFFFGKISFKLTAIIHSFIFSIIRRITIICTPWSSNAFGKLLCNRTATTVSAQAKRLPVSVDFISIPE